MADEKYQDNLRLIKSAQEGNEEACEQLILLNTGLVKSIASRFLGRGTDFEDLTQIGHIGLLKAIRTFDLARGCAFSTYAVPLIFGEIRRFLRDDGPIKVSRVQKRMGARLAAEREKMAKEGEYDAPISLLAERCGMTLEEASEALDALRPMRSLSELIYREEEGRTLENTLYDEGETEKSFDRIALSSAIAKLPELRRKIILLRYFRDFSQEKTARALGLSQVKVSREEKKILCFLREQLS
ncbi:MAG: sigma-70 family RNA polymerase sigma factor [Clostridia bacterium]|nr:sigma-70 family RNA polymerase sigma factor [Clostridia bacterium]